MKCQVLGVNFDNITMGEAVRRAGSMLAGDKACYVVTPNTEIVWRCRSDAALTEAIRGADMVLPDGIGVVYAARILGTPIRERVPGIDFITEIFRQVAGTGKGVFLLGAKPGVAEQAARNLTASHPGLNICGTSDGYFTDDAAVIDKINASGADILLVCLGFPRQECWMHANAHRINVKLMAGLGGSLDVFAGIVRRAPEKWQKLGLEWLYRLLENPARIKRMMVLPAFMAAVIRERLTGGRNKKER